MTTFKFIRKKLTQYLQAIRKMFGFKEQLMQHIPKTFPVEIIETDDFFYVCAQLPGISKEDIEVKYLNHYVCITAVHEKIMLGEKRIHSEIQYGEFSRNIYVGENINEQNIQAKYDVGMLFLTLYKRPLSIPVNIG